MKITQRILYFALAVAISAAIGCKKGNTNTPTPTPPPGSGDVNELTTMNAPASFNYNTEQKVRLDITIQAPDNSPIQKIPVSIYDKPISVGGKLIFKALTDASGKIAGDLILPSYVTQVVVDPNYLGVLRNAVVGISGQSITCILGGANGYSGNVIPDSPLGERTTPGKNNNNTYARPLAAYAYMGTYNNVGKPNYLEPVNDVINAAFLDKVNASLPERMPVMTYHPDYLASGIETNVHITQLSDVWFTFLTEGAGYMNSIAYFTYPTNTPPATASAIDTLRFIFPNASLSGSGGALLPGMKVKLGRFDAGTSIGFAMVANGWNGSVVGNGYHTVYSIDNLNPEATASLRRHTVFLYDGAQDVFLTGFEDILRNSSGCDNDFNDLLFYVKSNPVTAIQKTNVNLIDRPVDSDGDGVNDVYDDFPNDATKAYINYFPGQKEYGTLAFEDNWPFLGDYDVNDLVVDYRYTTINDNLNRTIEINAEYILRASGATFRNGFGVEFPFAASAVQSVTGGRVTNNQVVTLGANGCETGHTKAVIIPFDDAFNVMNAQSGYINTYMANPLITPDTIRMTIKLNSPITQANLGTAPFNPFIIINRTRGREAHLSGYTPTLKADVSFFKTGQDNTIPAQNKYYKTVSNLPYGIAFSQKFLYPVEGKAINAVYSKFVAWAQSGGTSFPDWYSNASYIVNSNLYRK
ncbi:MAG: LruC domain-containing protein [Ferruginibacter sp.]